MAIPEWHRQLKPASFRGVRFEVDTVDRSEGLSTVLRNYPFQDLPTIFSMGQAEGEMKFSAYVIGSDYMSKRDALERALLQQESGVLVHPTIGSVRVWMHGKFNIKENPTAEGGMARFDLTFIRAESRRYPIEAVNTKASTFAAALAMMQAAIDAFVARFSLAGAAGWVRTNVLGTLFAVENMLWTVALAIKNGGGEADGLAALLQLGRMSLGMLGELLLTPQDFAKRFVAMLSLDDNLEPEQAAYALAQLMPHDAVEPPFAWLDFALPARESMLPSLIDVVLDVPDVPFLTDSRAVEAAMVEAVQTFVQRIGYAALVMAAAQAEFENYDVAMDVRTVINAQGVRLMQQASLEPATATVAPVSLASASSNTSSSTASSLNASSNSTTNNAAAVYSIHDALAATHRAGLSHVQARSRELARLISFVPQSDDNIYAISHQLYGSTAFADEVWAMNRHITNPMLVPAGVPLRVIDHAS